MVDFSCDMYGCYKWKLPSASFLVSSMEMKLYFHLLLKIEYEIVTERTATMHLIAFMHLGINQEKSMSKP